MTTAAAIVKALASHDDQIVRHMQKFDQLAQQPPSTNPPTGNPLADAANSLRRDFIAVKHAVREAAPHVDGVDGLLAALDEFANAFGSLSRGVKAGDAEGTGAALDQMNRHFSRASRKLERARKKLALRS